MAASFAVKGRPKDATEETTAPLTLRRFASRDAAAAYALKVNMAVWDDVWVEPEDRPPPPPEPTAPPPFPWSVHWEASFAYVVDSTGRKIASLLGSQKQREFVADIICSLGPPAP